MLPSGIDPLLLVYVLAFGGAALVCFGSLALARDITDPETRRGLVWLLALSGGWAATHVGFLLAPANGLKMAFYLGGLVVGLATVGPWLYFCSAYTGRTLHRDPTYRRVAVVAFVAISLLKVTNPLHGLYVTPMPAATPFPHLAVEPGALHWIVAGLAYTLTGFGGFALFDRFRRAGADTGPLFALLVLVGLPIGLDLVGYATPFLIEITHEPLGVAVFAVGALVLYTERFTAVRLTSDVDDPVIVLDGDDHVRDYNEQAVAAFPALETGSGQPLSSVVPALATPLDVADRGGEPVPDADAAPADDAAAGDPGAPVDSDPPVVPVASDGETRYYRPSTTSVELGGTSHGRRLVLVDVSETERQRRALERQNERLDRFASAVSHDLRNPLNAASAQLEVARAQLDGENRHLDAVADEQARMERMIADLLTLAREGRDIGGTEPVSLAALAQDCWSRVEPGERDATLEVGSDLRFEADPDRLTQVLENLFRNAVEHGSTESDAAASDEHAGVTVRVGALADGDGFYVADDGPGISADRRDRVFETGHTTADGGTGFGLAIVEEIVTAHGWEVRAVESERGGARFEIRGVDPV
ncbi:ATP-binding protein [Haloglomus litoreum]|uniref:sensor histidine kinase n=1 Tax=Haloglomus litoreum TaxID=3034026 RepID=UPI0023E8C154|nr:ATP-binding protein [Haloglomus sp. DT116]